MLSHPRQLPCILCTPSSLPLPWFCSISCFVFKIGRCISGHASYSLIKTVLITRTTPPIPLWLSFRLANQCFTSLNTYVHTILEVYWQFKNSWVFYFYRSVYSFFASAFMCEMAQPCIDRNVLLIGFILIKLSKLWNQFGPNLQPLY